MALSKKPQTLTDWLNYIEGLHSSEIEFGLCRVNEVFVRLFRHQFKCRVITVGGTNGKGSTCSLIESLLLNAGYRCGKNTSPHISTFNERIVVNGLNVSDANIINAFQRIEAQREDVLLTYFEYTFLAALVIFDQEDVDFAICEVGMGGRLDAVNILSPDVCVITNIGLDHTQWLGETKAEIALEKVAISRSQKPCVIGDLDLSENARQYLLDNDVPALFNGTDFSYEIFNDGWQLNLTGLLNDQYPNDLLKPLPILPASHYYQNASCAILAVLSLGDIELNHEYIESALIQKKLEGRCQVLSEKPLIIVDVAHNQDSVAALSQFVQSVLPNRNEKHQAKMIAVLSMLDDKDICNTLSEINHQIDEWHIAELDTPRAASLDEIYSAIKAIQLESKVFQYSNLAMAYNEAKKSLESSDCLLVFGSFFTVSDILSLYQK